MPLLATSVPPGFEPHSSIVAPEVFEEMRTYMNCVDPEERRRREIKMRKTLDELSRDPVAQRACLRLEKAPVLSIEGSRKVGHVFDFRSAMEVGIPDIVESSVREVPLRLRTQDMGNVVSQSSQEGSGAVGFETEKIKEIRGIAECSPNKKVRRNMREHDGVEVNLTELERGGFNIGCNTTRSVERDNRSRGSGRSKQSWSRRNQHKRQVLEVVRRGWNLNTEGNRGTVSERIQSCRKELSKWKQSSTSNSRRYSGAIFPGSVSNLWMQKCRYSIGRNDAESHLQDEHKAQELRREFRLPMDYVFQDVSLIELFGSCLKFMEASTFNQERRQAIPWILWTIWKNRNSLLYAETQESPSLLVQRTLEEAALWNELNKAESNGGQVQADMGMPKYWFPPTQGMIKCNLHASWRSDKQFIGVAWITRNHRGDVCMHARDALVPTSDKLAAEMECLLWVLRSLRDLRIEEASIGTESQKLIDAIKTPARWPRYRCLLRQIETVCLEFTVIEFEVESRESNKVARKISTSVLRDGRLRSYLALGGPAWLHDLIQTEVIGEL
ncbi:hypothetical protein IGI04_001678 [Brassica rapa subsp. trilocularis]|uniref:RNase H type-1 domain-containing protein n=1 Tax=Brassica rapa subsp. trilocularis TaxID=1813537 RepID=A0ABQ7NVE9_BRACM|nr:hypothetical protein IGI04_001678 [Brassica rapa subsp. trilocularis]